MTHILYRNSRSGGHDITSAGTTEEQLTIVRSGSSATKRVSYNDIHILDHISNEFELILEIK